MRKVSLFKENKETHTHITKTKIKTSRKYAHITSKQQQNKQLPFSDILDWMKLS